MGSVKCAFDSNELYDLLGGYWYADDNHADFRNPHFTVDYLVIGSKPQTFEFPNTCLIAMKKETWLRGTGNTGHFANVYNDPFIELVNNYSNPRVKNNIVAVISEKPIPEFSGVLPQLILDNPYKAINTLAVAARKKMEGNGTIIAVTGAVGKSTTVRMLYCLLKDESDYISNINGHNSRTGVPMWFVSTGRFNPEFKEPGDKPNVCTLEVAAAALWMREGGICKIVQPHIGIITQIALTQYQEGSRNIRDVAIAKSKICQGIVPGGKAVLYRNMPDFEFVRESAINYGAIPVSYGEDNSCDTYVTKSEFEPPTAGEEIGELSTKIEAVVLGEKVSYTIGAIGKPVVLNSLAALTAAKLAGFDINSIAWKLAGFKGNANVLQIFNCCGVCVVNNSHNLEIPSIIAAFDLFMRIKQKPGTRKIVLMSRVDNWAEKTQELHLQLTDTINESGFDMFFFHEPLDEFSLLVDTIPAKIVGGRFRALVDVVAAVANDVREGDSVLAIGSHFTSDFGNVIDLLTKAINRKFLPPQEENSQAELPVILQTDSPTQPAKALSASVLAFSADKNRIVFSKGNLDERYPGGLGLLIFMYYLLDLIKKEELSWRDEVTVNENAANEAHYSNSLGLVHREKVSLITLFQAVVVNNCPDAIIALAGHVYEKIGKSRYKTVPALRKIGDVWGIPESAIKNITGRYYDNNQQHFTPEMLLKTARQLLSFDFKNNLSIRSVLYKGKYFELDNILDGVPVSHCFTFSTGLSINVVCMCEYGDETIFIAVCGAKTQLERDQLLLEAIHRSRTPFPKPHDCFIQTDKTALAVCGDTYCGERYTKWRIERNIDDPIQRYGDEGYAYSFEKVAPLISQSTFNIVNSECVLSPVYNESQQTGKYLDFILGAHPEKTVACYKKVNIGAVMLANNHTMDFGKAGCRQTRKYFDEAGLNPIGAGSNIDEAEKPLLVVINGKQVIVFNAYCFFLEKRHKLLNHYCLGANTGSAFGNDILEDLSLWRRIRTYREKYPNAYIVFSPHWSTDFNERHLHLRSIAAKAFNAGVDIIIGHGPHITIGAEHVNGKLCVYSIGNFVFNTTGIDLDASGKSPYGIVSQIGFSMKNPELRLYPIYAHNLNTFFQPHPVTDIEQFEEFSASFIGLSKFESRKDDIGYYLYMNV